MNRLVLRTSLLALLMLSLAALPAAAQVIPAGPDRWVTPPDGGTAFTFPPGDVESLCGAPPSNDWDRTAKLKGVPASGADWDTAVTRLKDADLSSGSASVPIRVDYLHFESIDLQVTPCGKIHWHVGLTGNQPIEKMVIKRTSDRGGVFEAVLPMRVVFKGIDADGRDVGALFYTFKLPDPGGTPWSFGGPTGWRPGIDEAENCFDVLREKAGVMGGEHVYFIENLIAQGRCDKRPN